MELIPAKVPILKFRDLINGIEVDLNCNNMVGIRNTHLLRGYSSVDIRVKQLVVVIKLWARQHDINDARNMTISSYSLTLMIIHYLQCGVYPPVVPCLQQMLPEKFGSYIPLHEYSKQEQFTLPLSENKMNVGELLLGFLHYFSYEFNFETQAMSIRVGSSVPISMCRYYPRNDPHQWKFLCIEEPFNLSNTARSVYDQNVFERIKKVFRICFHRLKNTSSLHSIFESVPDSD